MVDFVKEYESMVHTIALQKHREFPMVPKDDIVQELWLWFITHPNKLEEWHNLESKKESTKLFARALHNASRKFCVAEKAKTKGYEISDLFYYRRDIVEELLPSVLAGDLQVTNTADYNSGNRSTFAPSEGGNLLAMQADISRAFSRLREEQQNILYLWYYNNRNSKELGVALQINEKTARMKVLRAIDSLIRKLGGKAPYPDRDTKNVVE